MADIYLRDKRFSITLSYGSFDQKYIFIMIYNVNNCGRFQQNQNINVEYIRKKLILITEYVHDFQNDLYVCRKFPTLKKSKIRSGRNKLHKFNIAETDMLYITYVY